MADGNETTIKVKTDADTSGAEKAQREHRKIGTESEKAARTATNAFRKIIGELGNLRAAGQRVQKILGTVTKIGFVASGVESIVNLFEKMTAESRKAKEEAKKLAETNRKLADAADVERLADAYKKLSDAISDAAKARERANELEDIGRNQARDLEDKEAQLEKIKAINALDPNDPHYNEKKAAIERRFEEASATRAVSRAREDNGTERRRLLEQAEAIGGDAGQLEFSLHDDDAKIAALRQRAAELKFDAKHENDYDDSWGGQVKNLLTFNFGRWKQGRTAEGDEERKRQAEEAKQLEEEAKRLQKERDEKARQVARMKAEAQHATDKALALSGNEDNFDAAERINTANAEQPKIQAEAARRVMWEGGEKTAELHSQEDMERARAQAAANAYEKEAGDVLNAQNAYDMLVANGGSRKEKSAALAALQKEQAEAQEAQHEMERVAAQVATTLQGINGQIKALAKAVQQAEGRLAQNQADAPEG